MSLVKLQTFRSWSFINQPTPFFGACLSTSGLSLLGISGVWPPHSSKRVVSAKIPMFADVEMARFMIHWCAPDPTNEKYTQAIVDYIKGGKPMDEYTGFKVLARQIHPHLGGGVLLVEADNLAAVQKHTYPWTKGLGVTATITPGLSDEEYVELEESMAS